MLDGLPILAGVNLALSMVLAIAAGSHRPRTIQQRALAGVPALWALLMLGADVYLWVTMPPTPIATGPDGHLIVLRHGDVDWLLWESRVNVASALALWLTVATMLGLLVFLVARSRQIRRWRGVINWDS